MPDLTINDFSGGIIDDIIDAPLNTFESLDNFIIDKNARATSRPGSEVVDIGLSPNQRIIGGPRINNIQTEGSTILLHETSKLWKSDGTELTGPTGNSFLGSGTSSTKTAVDYIKSHSIWTSSDRVLPRKVYTESSTIKTINAGLPKINKYPRATVGGDTGTAKSYLYAFHYQYQYSIGDIRFIDRGPVTIMPLVQKLSDIDATNPVTLNELPSIANGSTENYDTASVTLEIYRTADNGSFFQLVGSVTNGTATFVDQTLDAERGIGLYIDSGEFDDDSPPKSKYVAVAGSSAWYANVEESNTTKYRIETVADVAGSLNNTYFFVDSPNDELQLYVWYNVNAAGTDPGPFAGRLPIEVAINTNDNAVAVALATQIELSVSSNSRQYWDIDLNTGSNVVDMTSVGTGRATDPTDTGSTGFTFNVDRSGSIVSSFRVRQSKPGNFDSCPQSFFVDVEGDITGISSVGINPIVFTETSVTRLEGVVDAFGNGVTIPRTISATVGSINHNCIVRTFDGLYFCSLDGWYFCDGFRIQKLSEHLNDTYASLIDTQAQKDAIFGIEDRANRRIYWAMTKSGSVDNDIIYVLDPAFGLNQKSTFTTWSGGNNIRPTSLSFIDRQLYRGDTQGYLFRHNNDETTDPVIDTATNTEDWLTVQQTWDLRTIATSFGDDRNRKWMRRLTMSFDTNTALSLQPSAKNDIKSDTRDFKLVRSRDNVLWGDPSVIWGDPELVWNFTGLIIAQRKFPKAGFRCTYEQIYITNADTYIYRSDDYATATIDAAANTLTLNNLAEKTDITCPSASTFTSSGSADYFLINSADDATEYYVWYDVDSGNTDPSIAGKTGIEVNVSSGNGPNVVASLTAGAISALGDFGAGTGLDGNGPEVVTVTNAATGSTTDASDVSAGVTIFVSQQGTSVIWPNDLLGYDLIAELDSTVRHEILSRDSDAVITVQDAQSTLQNGSQSWEIKGINKGERLTIENMVITYAQFGDSQTGFNDSDEGGNA